MTSKMKKLIKPWHLQKRSPKQQAQPIPPRKPRLPLLKTPLR